MTTPTDREHLAGLLRDHQPDRFHWDANDIASEYALADAILAAGYRRGSRDGLDRFPDESPHVSAGGVSGQPSKPSPRGLAPADAAQIGRATLTLRTVATALDLLAGDTK